MKINARSDGRVELVCQHGVGHPSSMLTEARGVEWAEWMGVHGCDGCCEHPNFQKNEERLLGQAAKLRRSR